MIQILSPKTVIITQLVGLTCQQIGYDIRRLYRKSDPVPTKAQYKQCIFIFW